MVADYKQLRQLIVDVHKKQVEANTPIGEIGEPLGSEQYTIDTEDEPGFIQVLTPDRGLITAFNAGAPRIARYPVRLEQLTDGTWVAQPDFVRAIGFLGDQAGVVNPFVAPHTHSLESGLVDEVELRRFVPGRVTVHTGMVVKVDPLIYRYSSSEAEFQGGAIDLDSYQGSTAGTWRFVKVGINPATNALVATAGTDYYLSTTPTRDQIKAISFAGYIPLAAVYIKASDTAITQEKQIWDCRIVVYGGESLAVADHGALTGLADDDHTQYVILTPTTTTRNLISAATATALGLAVSSSDASTTNPLFETRSGATAIVTMSAAVSNDNAKNFLRLAGTMPTTPTASVEGVRINITGAGSTSQVQAAVRVLLSAGYTGGSATAALTAANSSAGTDTGTTTGNIGVSGTTNGSTAGHNNGVRGLALNSTLRNVGVLGQANTPTVGDNIGVWGFSDNVGGGRRIAVFASLDANAPNMSAAMLVNNSALAQPIFVAQDNAAAVFTIADGGAVTSTVTTSTLIPLTIKGAASQSGNLTEWQNSSGTPLTYIEADGEIVIDQDSKAIKFGADQDATILYDGTNLVVDPKAVGSGYLDLTGGLKVDSITNDTGLAHGTYTPTRSAEANLDANVTMTQAQYLRVGNTVTVSGRFTADPTLTATATSFEITLPVASNIGAVEDLAGVAFCGSVAQQGAEIIGVVANDTAKIQWMATDITSQTWSYTFTYEVI